MFELEITDSSFSPRSGALNLTNYHAKSPDFLGFLPFGVLIVRVKIGRFRLAT